MHPPNVHLSAQLLMRLSAQLFMRLSAQLLMRVFPHKAENEARHGGLARFLWLCA
jgi:hypothetical protein